MPMRVPCDGEFFEMCGIGSGQEGVVDGTSEHSGDSDALLFHLFQLHRARLLLHTVSKYEIYKVHVKRGAGF